MPTTGSLDAFENTQVREIRPQMATGLILAGLGLAAVGIAGRYALRAGRIAQKTINEQMKSIPQSGAFSKYYRGGFEPKMSKREASLILGVSPSASKMKIKEAHKRIMLLNHPDRVPFKHSYIVMKNLVQSRKIIISGGSPYMAAKINEAKDYLDKARPGSS